MCFTLLTASTEAATSVDAGPAVVAAEGHARMFVAEVGAAGSHMKRFVVEQVA